MGACQSRIESLDDTALPIHPLKAVEALELDNQSDSVSTAPSQCTQPEEPFDYSSIADESEEYELPSEMLDETQLETDEDASLSVLPIHATHSEEQQPPLADNAPYDALLSIARLYTARLDTTTDDDLTTARATEHASSVVPPPLSSHETLKQAGYHLLLLKPSIADDDETFYVCSHSLIVQGLPWKLSATRSTNNGHDSLKCNLFVANDAPAWNCQCEGALILYANPEAQSVIIKFDNHSFDGTLFLQKDLTSWDSLFNSNVSFLHDGKIFVYALFRIKRCVGIRKMKNFDLCTPSPLFDGHLLIEGRDVYVNKSFLAMHSSYFKTLFFSDFKEKTQKAVELKGVPYNQFVDLLTIVLPSGKSVDVDRVGVDGLLSLADRFDFEEAKHKIEDILLYNDKLTTCQKLAIADEHGLIALQGHCLALLDRPRKVRALAGEDEFGGLSDKLKVAVLLKML